MNVSTDVVKLTSATIVSALIAYIQPLHKAMFALLYIFIINMVFGILSDIIVNRKRLSTKKFMLSMAYAAIYLSVIVSVYVVGEKMGDVWEALFIDKTLTYVFIYFYVANIFKNLKALFPRNRPIAFLDYILHLEVLKRIPELHRFLQNEENLKEKTDEKTGA